jgi:hypothetical protein
MKYLFEYTNNNHKEPGLPEPNTVIELNTLEELHAFIEKSGCEVVIKLIDKDDPYYSKKFKGVAARLELINDWR